MMPPAGALRNQAIYWRPESAKLWDTEPTQQWWARLSPRSNTLRLWRCASVLISITTKEPR